MILAPATALAMVKHARRDAPLEAVGAIVAGPTGDVVVEFLNAHPDPARRYAVNALELLEFEQVMEDEGQRCMGIYHSHPTTAAVPSGADITEWHRPDIPCLIVALAPRLDIRAWRIHGSDVAEEPVFLGS